MDIVVNGRQLTISDSFRAHIEDKIAKVEQLAPRAQRVEVHVTHEKNSRQPETSERSRTHRGGEGAGDSG
jgi:ribosomal subunit interface protein